MNKIRNLFTVVLIGLLLGVCSTALAQGIGQSNGQGNGQGNAAVRSVIGFTNLLDPGLVAQLQATHADETSLADALLGELSARGLVADDIVATVRAALTSGNLTKGQLIVFASDLLNGPAPLASRDPGTLEQQLKGTFPGLRLPAGGMNKVMQGGDVIDLVGRVAANGRALEAVREAYERATTPRNPGEAGRAP